MGAFSTSLDVKPVLADHVEIEKLIDSYYRIEDKQKEDDEKPGGETDGEKSTYEENEGKGALYSTRAKQMNAACIC